MTIQTIQLIAIASVPVGLMVGYWVGKHSVNKDKVVRKLQNQLMAKNKEYLEKLEYYNDALNSIKLRQLMLESNMQSPINTTNEKETRNTTTEDTQR